MREAGSSSRRCAKPRPTQISSRVSTTKPDVLAILPRLVKDLALRRQLEDAIDGVFGAMSKRAATIADKLERRGTVQQKSRKARIAK